MDSVVGAISLKIAFYTRGSAFHGNTLEEKALGGSESALLYLARELARRGHEVNVFCTCDRPGQYDGVGYFPETELLTYCGSHPQDVTVFSRVYEPLAAARSRVKVLWLHDVAFSKYYDALPALDTHIDRYFAISRWQMGGYIDKFGFESQRFYLTRNGVDLSLFEGGPERNPRKLIYINTPFRGLDVLINIFPVLRQAVPDAELHLYTGMSLYGGQFADWEDELKALYEHARKMPGVFLREPLRKRDLARELMSSRLSLYPCHFEECCSIASLEVQAAGVPMITSDLAGLRDTIRHGETGILVPMDDAKLRSRSRQYQLGFLNCAVALLRDDAAWTRMSRNASELIRQHYSWPQVAAEWEQEFVRLMAASRGA